ncbi:LysE family translocator [Comamonas faecalis]
MSHYPLFLSLSLITVLMPGSAVLMTLSTALTRDRKASVYAIAGLICGSCITCAAAMLGGAALLASVEASALRALELASVGVLAYLAVRAWRAAPLPAMQDQPQRRVLRRIFVSGLMLQCVNPYLLVYVMATWPQFLDRAQPLPLQLLALLGLHALVTLGVHSGYAALAHRACRWLGGRGGALQMRRFGALAYLGFGASLALRLVGG